MAIEGVALEDELVLPIKEALFTEEEEELVGGGDLRAVDLHDGVRTEFAQQIQFFVEEKDLAAADDGHHVVKDVDVNDRHFVHSQLELRLLVEEKDSRLVESDVAALTVLKDFVRGEISECVEERVSDVLLPLCRLLPEPDPEKGALRSKEVIIVEEVEHFHVFVIRVEVDLAVQIYSHGIVFLRYPEQKQHVRRPLQSFNIHPKLLHLSHEFHVGDSPRMRLAPEMVQRCLLHLTGEVLHAIEEDLVERGERQDEVGPGLWIQLEAGEDDLALGVVLSEQVEQELVGTGSYFLADYLLE